MQELANDASESTRIASRGQEGLSSEHLTAKLQQRANISERLKSRLDQFMLPQDDNTLDPVK